MKKLVTLIRNSITSAPAVLLGMAALQGVTTSTHADETCSSPYLARIEGQEEFVYVWTLGVEGLGGSPGKTIRCFCPAGSGSGTADRRATV